MKYIYSPNSYFLLFKLNLHQDYNLVDQRKFPDRIVLGGVYECTKEDDNFIYTEKNGKILRNRMIPYKEGKYSYKVGDYVTFHPICTEREVESLTFDNNLIVDNKYKIHRIINYYYMQVINEKGNISDPLRFCDVKSIT